MWGKRPKVDYSQLPASPPNPDATQAQFHASQAANHREWEVFIVDEVLRCVNAALYSVEFVEYRPRMLTVWGTQEKVSVFCVWEDITWVKYLLAALNSDPAYRKYKISFIGVRGTGAHWKSTGPSHEFFLLSKDDLDKSAQAFLDDSTWTPYFQVDIEL